MLPSGIRWTIRCLTATWMCITWCGVHFRNDKCENNIIGRDKTRTPSFALHVYGKYTRIQTIASRSRSRHSEIVNNWEKKNRRILCVRCVVGRCGHDFMQAPSCVITQPISPRIWCSKRWKNVHQTYYTRAHTVKPIAPCSFANRLN